MTHDPRDVEIAERAFDQWYPGDFRIDAHAPLALILAARLSREAAEARTVEGVDPDVQTNETHLEPLAKRSMDRSEAALVSIAVSLKRLADGAGKEARHG